MSPVEIEVLLHCYCIREPHTRMRVPVIRETFQRFERSGLIMKDLKNLTFDNVEIYITTEKGTALAYMLMQTPLPESAWIDPRTGKIIKREE